jgi:hypothetical protein
MAHGRAHVCHFKLGGAGFVHVVRKRLDLEPAEQLAEARDSGTRALAEDVGHRVVGRARI